MNTRNRFIILLALAWICILEGGLFVLIPSSSSFITKLEFQSFTYSQYGALLSFWGIGAFLAGIFMPIVAQKKGVYKFFFLAMILQFISLYFLGMVGLTLFSSAASFLFFSVSVFFCGAANISMVMLTTGILSHFFPNKKPTMILLFFSLFAVGNILFSILLSQGRFIFLFAFILISFVTIFFLFNFYLPEFPSPEKSTLKKAWLVPLVIPMALMAINETVIMNWAILYLTDIKKLDVVTVFTAVVFLFLFVGLAKFFLAVIVNWVPLRKIYALLPLLLVSNSLWLSFDQQEINKWLIISSLGLNSAVWALVFSFGVTIFPKNVWRISGLLLGIFFLVFGIVAYLFVDTHLHRWITPQSYFKFMALFMGITFICTVITLKQTSQKPL